VVKPAKTDAGDSINTAVSPEGPRGLLHNVATLRMYYTKIAAVHKRTKKMAAF
jgi:hypothetical protein